LTLTDYADVVAALREVPGVADAGVEPDEAGGGLGLLRLGLVPGADEVEVATEVGRLLRDRFGLGVDADRVQLVEDTSDVTAPAPRSSAGGRLTISRMQIISSGLDVTAVVTLRRDKRRHEGQATGTATQTGVQRAVAGATLRALEGLLDEQTRFELESVEVATNGRCRTALVNLILVSGTGSERLTGAAAVRDDVRQACIRATLDAVNRRVEPLLR
jgi:hypothetical protein